MLTFRIFKSIDNKIDQTKIYTYIIFIFLFYYVLILIIKTKVSIALSFFNTFVCNLVLKSSFSIYHPSNNIYNQLSNNITKHRITYLFKFS